MRIKYIIIALALLLAFPSQSKAQEEDSQLSFPQLDTLQFIENQERINRHAHMYSLFGDMSSGQQQKVMQDSGYYDLLLFKLKKGRGYHLTQPFVSKESKRNKYALLNKHAYSISADLTFYNTLVDYYLFEPIMTVDEIDQRIFNFEVSAGYFVEDNTSIGLKFGYGLSDSRMTIESPMFELIAGTEDMIFNHVTSSLHGGAFVKNYIPLDEDHQIFIVNETTLRYSYEHSLWRDSFNEGTRVIKVEQHRHLFGVGVTPGFMYFLTPALSLEFLISPLFVYYEKRSIVNNETEEGSWEGAAFNSIITPLNMKFGITYFFGLNYKRGTDIGIY